jgi:hypothetical protein
MKLILVQGRKTYFVLSLLEKAMSPVMEAYYVMYVTHAFNIRVKTKLWIQEY